MRQQIFPNPKKVLAKLPQALHKPLRFLLAPFLVDSFRYGTLHQRLQRLSRVIPGIVKLKSSPIANCWEKWQDSQLTTSKALIVVSSLEAALAPSSGQPPSHIPAKAAIDLAALKYMRRSESSVMAGTHLNSSLVFVCSGSGDRCSGGTPGRYSGKRA